jgi:UDP-N-acetylglucosamine:LPS N-acetylglucosamine transferase
MRSVLFSPESGEATGKKRVLAVASGGGHWVQLLRVAPAFDEHELVFVTVNEAYRDQVPSHRFHTVKDGTRWNKLALLQMALQLAWIIRSERPDVIISTGAAPGYFALRLGRFLGIQTIWLDSIANVERMSLSGEKVGRHADLWLTQWPHLARPEGPFFAGAVL